MDSSGNPCRNKSLNAEGSVHATVYLAIPCYSLVCIPSCVFCHDVPQTGGRQDIDVHVQCIASSKGPAGKLGLNSHFHPRHIEILKSRNQAFGTGLGHVTDAYPLQLDLSSKILTDFL